MARLLQQAFKAYPLACNCLFYGGVWTTVESTKQAVFRNVLPKRFQSPYPITNVSSAAVGLVGTCVAGPTLYYWYKWLDMKYVGTTMTTVARKCLLDQILMNPYTWIIMISVVLMTAKPPPGQKDISEDAKEIFKTIILPSYLIDSSFWIPAQAVNFMYFQPHQRMVYIGVSTLVWTFMKIAALVAYLD